MFGINNPQISVVNLTFHDTGSYGDQVLRPYQTSVDQYSINSINDSIHNTQRAGSEIILNPLSLKSTVGSAITVSSRPSSSIYIDNGWAENRLRFILIIEVSSNLQSSPMMYYFQGYTNYKGVTNSGNIDPNMVLVINSFIAVKKVETRTNLGNSFSSRVIQSSNVINLTQADKTRNFSTIRPSDLFATMQINTFANALDGDLFEMYDTRTTPIMNDPLVSNKRNANPTDYLSNVINSYTRGVIQSETNNENNYNRHIDNSSIGNAIDISSEPVLTDNPFIRALSGIMSTPGAITRFTISQLAEIDGYVGSKITYVDGTRSLHQMQAYNNYESWNSQTREAVAATIIFNSVASIMMDMFIMNVSLVSTNATLNAIPNTTIINVNSPDISNIRKLADLLCFRLENEVMWGLTFGNQDLYTVEINIDLYGGSYINISFNNEPATPFQRATFADSLYQPIVTSDKFQRDAISTDVETLLNNLDLGVYTYDNGYSANTRDNTNYYSGGVIPTHSPSDKYI